MATTENVTSSTGLTEAEAKEFHAVYSQSAAGFLAVCAVAHVLAWMWRPFWPGAEGWVMDTAQNLTFLA
ncbi:light-harvesting antenna LH1, beta subunit [Roseospirillum parvum]|uniref:Beta subunit of light-harvesting 1 complex n=1 Tax=Roseospirillum parvum TaxID=83401 RepID=Q6XBJ9_9PROT|nr:light-harvesting antenna LH1, beta subunit [Roseospirillum parvum]AAP70699.1 beta subunit of light-harvesting 1 complex [Roseospirillum parvum]SDH36626.1 light-harvesting complex 1 beta chain [Roseospirillum parvum]